MGTISRRLSRFCYNHPRLGIPNLMRYIAMGNVFVFLMDLMGGQQAMASALLSFSPGLILSGQVWRLVTFLIVPITISPIWFLLTTWVYYSIGTALEHSWGTARFSLYYFLGAYLNVILGFAAHLLAGGWLASPVMFYVNQSLFFAFATLYPETQFLIYFIIPVKAKWLAWLSAAMLAFNFGSYLVGGVWLGAVMVVGSVLNYLLFFWDDLIALSRRGVQRAERRVDPKTIQFKRAQKEVQQRKGYLHKCAVCGLTDAQDSNMEFRYCSKCNGYHCYCMDHINNHTHVQ